MIYGANGYTGRLLAAEAARRGFKPVLAGRGESVVALARELGLEARIFGLEVPEETVRGLQGMEAVLHCAGPFSATARPMLDACIAVSAHYLDITGEISVFEEVHARSAEIANARITALPGTGFDVVPSDCLAAMLSARLPTATHLTLAFEVQGPVSPGTAKTMVEGLSQGGVVRRGGRITRTGIAAREIDFGHGPRSCVRIPWGDVSTAYFSTGIQNIEVFSRMALAQARAAWFIGLLARLGFVRDLLKSAAQRWVRGPSEEQRETLRCRLWGEVRDYAGAREELRLEIPESYCFTVNSALACMDRVLRGGVKVGAVTPSSAFGAEFVLGLEGVVKA